MKRCNKKAYAAGFMAVSMAVSMAGGNGMAVRAEEASDLDYVELKMFAICDAPTDTDLAKQYWEQLNERLKEELNCTIDFTYAAGNDYRNNYALAITSGEKYDLMMAAAGWLDYQAYSMKHAFTDLTGLIPEYAPYLWENVPDSAWEAVTVDGSIYAVPNLKMSMTIPTFVYREDLRKKYDLPEIDSMEAVETYLQGIKDNEPTLLPSNDYQCQVYGASWIHNTKYIGIDEIHDKLYNFVYDPDTGEVLTVFDTPEYKDYMYKMKDWADRGFWPSSVLASTNWGVMEVLNGAAAASFNEQLPNYNYHATQVEQEHGDEGWELGYYMYFEGNPDAFLDGTRTDNMVAVAATAEHPERALMVLDYIHQHEDLWDFLTYGMEGINYNLTEDGNVDVTNIAEGANFDYFPSRLIENASLEKRKGNEWKDYDVMMQKINDRIQQNPFDGFVLDKSEIEAEYTALFNVQSEYGYPLQAGLVNDVDSALEQYQQAAKAAGLDKVKEEVTRQAKEWLASKEQ